MKGNLYKLGMHPVHEEIDHAEAELEATLMLQQAV